MQIQSKLPSIGTNIFSVMSALAVKHNAVNLGQGFPDFPMSGELIGLVEKAMHDGMNQYTPMAGSPELRSALAVKVYHLYNTRVDPETMITVTPGATYAIFTAFTTVLRPGDEVVVFQPCYDSYVPNILTNGAVPVPVNLSFPDYSINWDEVRKKLTPRTRMIVLNSPHNPTGATLTEEDMQQLRDIVKGTDMLILSDEVYEHLVFDGAAHQSMLKYPDLLERAFVCFSFGKVFHCTGWKLGYCISSPSLMAEFRKVHQFNAFSTFSPAQPAIARYLGNPETYTKLAGFMQQKRDMFAGLMEQTRFRALACRGSYFRCYSYEAISDEPDLQFAERITKEVGVAAIPLSAFYLDGTDNRVVRFCFAKSEEMLLTAAERLKRL